MVGNFVIWVRQSSVHFAAMVIEYAYGLGKYIL